MDIVVDDDGGDGDGGGGGDDTPLLLTPGQLPEAEAVKTVLELPLSHDGEP